MAKTLVTSHLRFNRMDAQQYAKANGKTLASYSLLDEGVMDRRVRYVSYAREFAAYPASGKVFKENKDIVDPKTKSRIPLEFVKDLDIFRPGIGLVVDPKDLDTHKKTGGIVVLPESITLLEKFIQTGDKWVRGKPDKGNNNVVWTFDSDGRSVRGVSNEGTMVPLAVSEGLWNSLSDDEKRRFYRVSQQSVHPLVRDVRGYVGRHYVNALVQPHSVHGVAFEEDAREAGTAPSKQLSFSREGGKLVVEGTPEQLDAAVALLGKLNRP